MSAPTTPSSVNEKELAISETLSSETSANIESVSLWHRFLRATKHFFWDTPECFPLTFWVLLPFVFVFGQLKDIETDIAYPTLPAEIAFYAMLLLAALIFGVSVCRLIATHRISWGKKLIRILFCAILPPVFGVVFWMVYVMVMAIINHVLIEYAGSGLPFLKEVSPYIVVPYALLSATLVLMFSHGFTMQFTQDVYAEIPRFTPKADAPKVRKLSLKTHTPVPVVAPLSIAEERKQLSSWVYYAQFFPIASYLFFFLACASLLHAEPYSLGFYLGVVCDILAGVVASVATVILIFAKMERRRMWMRLGGSIFLPAVLSIPAVIGYDFIAVRPFIAYDTLIIATIITLFSYQILRVLLAPAAPKLNPATVSAE